MGDKKVKIVGYAQKVFYNDGIEYRNFSPDLVGLQLTSDGGTPLFTMGNFNITTNLEPKMDKTFITNRFSNFVTLTTLRVTLEEANTLLVNNAVVLNLDKRNTNYYALFGSFSEFIRVALEDVILNWPASLYTVPVTQTPTGEILNGFTFENYTYDSFYKTSTFKIETNFINNKFGINYLKNGTSVDAFTQTNSLRNLTTNYISYVILYNGLEYPVLEFTAATNTLNDAIYFKVSGDPFSGLTSQAKVNYHIKPNKMKGEAFFNSLPLFEYYLLSRDVIPQYTSSFKYPIRSDNGVVLYVTETLTWPVSDGYNIDFDTDTYLLYANKLLTLSTNSDEIQSMLMNRFLVSESINAFDTQPVHLSEQDQDTSGQKVNKTLQIYGVEFDEINAYISGIAFANTVTYDKQDNTPDVYLKNIARVMGWELVSSVLENDLLTSYLSHEDSTYSGQSIGLTPVEADTELWRRVILNTPWIWKSKGARKSVEFLLRFIGAPKGLIKFNEYIYRAKGPIDIDLFRKLLALNGLSTDISIYPIDDDGYPSPLPDTPDMYFQCDGLWYRETGGSGATIDILAGNNPHVGPYDGGRRYIDQFRCLIPDYSAVTVSSETITTNSQNLYTNYDIGRFDDGVTTATTIDTITITNLDDSAIGDCVVFIPSVKLDPLPSGLTTDCGCPTDEIDKMLSLCLERNPNIPFPPDCISALSGYTDDTNFGIYFFDYYQYNQDGSIYSGNTGQPVTNHSIFTSKQCCASIGGTPVYYVEVGSGLTINTGYICCDATTTSGSTNSRCGCTVACGWEVSPEAILLPKIGHQELYLDFIREDGTHTVVTPDGCNCIAGYTVKVPNIVDPYTGRIGYGCQLVADQNTNLIDTNIIKFYQQRASGITSCY